MLKVRNEMMLNNFGNVFRLFHRTKAIIAGLQGTIPAAGQTGQLTCQGASSLIKACSYRSYSQKCLHLQSPGLTQVKPLLMDQKRGRRKVYPDPFEGCPESYQLPVEDYKPEIDVYHVPEFNQKGPELVAKVQAAITGGDMGRLFAVVHVDGNQRKITTEDILIINGYFPPQIGDKIRLEKIMLVGSKDFTLIGRPLLSRDMVKVEATVVEKTLSHVRVHYTYKKRFRRLKLLQHPLTMIVINSIELNPAALT